MAYPVGYFVHLNIGTDEPGAPVAYRGRMIITLASRLGGMARLEPIQAANMEEALQPFVGLDVYIHLETTNGAYAAEGRLEPKVMAVCAYIRNGIVRFHRAAVSGLGPYRVGLQMENGWIYAEGLTDWEIDEQGRLLLAGHDERGRLAVALELSLTPFPV